MLKPSVVKHGPGAGLPARVEGPTLIELTKEVRDLVALLEAEPETLDPTGAHIQNPNVALAERLVASGALLKNKVDAYVAVHDECDARGAALRAQVKHLQEVARSYDRVVERLTACARIAAEILQVDRFEGATRGIRISTSSAQAIDVLDETKIPQDLKEQVVSWKVDKEKLAAAIALTSEGAVVRKDTGEDLSFAVRVRRVVSVRWK